MGIFSAIGNIVGSIFGRNSARKDAQRQRSFAREERDVSWEQHLDERRYGEKLTAADRKYAESLTAQDRKYAEKLLFGERDYARKVTLEDRAYNNRMLGKDRRYAESVYEKEKRDLASSKVVDYNRYKADRSAMQKLADKQAIRTAASRGIDFARLRDDAVKAGFNPLTAMQWASAYNTEKGFGVMGDVYSGSASTPSQSIPGRASGGSTVAGGATPGATPMVGSINPGSNGFTTSGGGYGGTSTPAFMSADLGASLGDLIDTGLNWFNHKDDIKYQTIADQVARGQLAREYERQTPRAFGYSLSKIEPYRPSVSIYAPPLRDTDFDLMHQRPIEKQPVQNIPTTGYYDVGKGDPVRGLSQDVEWSEVTQMGNEAWLGANAAGRWWGEWASKRGLGGVVPMTFPKQNPRVPKGSGSFSLTGAWPKSPVLSYRDQLGGWGR